MRRTTKEALPQPCPTYLRDTDRILSISILRFRTSFTRPLSGPCFTFSLPIKYMHFGVSNRSRLTPCEERDFQKAARLGQRDNCNNGMPFLLGQRAAVLGGEHSLSPEWLLCDYCLRPLDRKESGIHDDNNTWLFSPYKMASAYGSIKRHWDNKCKGTVSGKSTNMVTLQRVAIVWFPNRPPAGVCRLAINK